MVGGKEGDREGRMEVDGCFDGKDDGPLNVGEFEGKLEDGASERGRPVGELVTGSEVGEEKLGGRVDLLEGAFVRELEGFEVGVFVG